MVLVPAKTTKRKTTVAQSTPSPAKKTKVAPAKKAPASKAKGTRRGSPNKNNAEDEDEEVEETTEEVEEEGSGAEEEGKEGEEEEGDENEEGDEEGGEEGDETENAGDTTAEGEGETKPEAAPSIIKKGTGPSKLEAYVFQNVNPHTSISDVYRVLRVNGMDNGLVNASIVVEFQPNVPPKNFLETAAKITFGGDHEKFKIGKYKPLEITEYVHNIPPPSASFKPWLKISVLDLEEETTKEEVKEIVESIVGEEVKVDTGNTTSMVVTFQSEKAFGKLLVHDDLKVKEKAVRLKIPFVSPSNNRNSNNRRSDFSPRKNGVSGSPVRGGRGGNAGGGYGGRGGGGGFYGGPKRGRGGAGRMGGGGYGYPQYMRPY